MDFTRQQKQILRVLKEADEPVSQQLVADRLGVDRSAVWKNLKKKLHEEKKIVETIGSDPRKYEIKEDIKLPPDVGTVEIKHGSGSGTPTPEKTVSLEGDVQNYLYENLDQLHKGMTAESDNTGKEYQVDSGFIDILAEGSEGQPVVIEIKIGKAKRDALGQIQAYMADIMSEYSDNVMGVIVANDFSQKLTRAVSINPNVELYNYVHQFKFEKY